MDCALHLTSREMEPELAGRHQHTKKSAFGDHVQIAMPLFVFQSLFEGVPLYEIGRRRLPVGDTLRRCAFVSARRLFRTLSLSNRYGLPAAATGREHDQ